jgi:NAD-dependent deacetylase
MRDSDPLEQGIRQAAERLRAARNVCVLTGAGVSAESGVPTFRDLGGLWQNVKVEDVASPEGFARNPKRVWEFFNARRAKLWTIQPNPAHYALAQLERRAPALTLITQNVDGLHHLAGSRNVVEIHGSLRTVRCVGCGRQRDASGETLPDEPRCADCGDWLRPAVVWFGEMLPLDAMERAEFALETCDVMLVVGTSGVVYPVAGFSLYAAEHGATIIDVNPDPDAISPACEISLIGKAGAILPRVMAAIDPV